MSESEDLGRKLYEACVSGSIPALNSLIEKDELILNRVNSLTCFFSETPLHVAVLSGHLDFIKALLIRKPNLVTEFDTRGCLPIHLASTEGHVEIVRELLRVNTNICYARDQDGRIPLHLAAMKGRVKVIEELLQAKPESINEKLGKGETVLHLCIKYSRLEALKTLLRYLQSCDDMEFVLNSGDDDGNTILHLAVALKQKETIKYLLGKEDLKDLANVKNKNGSTALDVVQHCPTKQTMEIRELLVQAGVQRKKWISRFWTTYFDLDPNWLVEVRGHLITAATLTATIAYQALFSPPGSLWTDPGNLNEALPPSQLNSDRLPGQAILDSDAHPSAVVEEYLILNTVVLVASLSTIMLALSGFPVRNKFLLWVLIYAVYTTILGLGIAYFLVLWFVFPSHTYDYIVNGVLSILACVIGFVLILHACHFLVWLRNKFGNLVKRCRTRGANHTTHEKSCCWLP